MESEHGEQAQPEMENGGFEESQYGIPEEPKMANTIQQELTCKACAGILHYSPSTGGLQCVHCGSTYEIEPSETPIEELDYEEYVLEGLGSIETQTLHTTQCKQCGAHVSFEENVVSDKCPFCDSVLVVSDTAAETQLQPSALLPFIIDSDAASKKFKKWMKGLWFAPSDMSKRARSATPITGIYTPYWTFDAETGTAYQGERGDDYTETEEYIVHEAGKPVTKSRSVTRTSWTEASGYVECAFDDVLVVASKTLPQNRVAKLDSWDLGNLVPYDERYLSGFRTEVYQMDLADSLEVAKGKMEEGVRDAVCRDIGGDQQRIHGMDISYSNVTFKHILLPIYISAFRYNGKVYRFLVNARTGEVSGERPYSAGKIILTILVVILIIWGLSFVV